MGVWNTIRGWFGRPVVAAGYPAIGDAIGGAMRRYKFGSYHESLRRSGYYYDGSKWAHGLSGSGRGPIIEHQTLRANARAAVHESMVARAIVDRYEQAVVDVGCRLDCTPDAGILGLTPEQADEWARDVEQRFHLWATSKLVTVAEDMNFYQAQRFSMRSRFRDGEHFPRLYYQSRRDLLNPLRLGFVDPNQILGDAFTDTYWPRTEADGITRDEFGREKSFKILVSKGENNQTVEMNVPAKSKSGLPLMLHAFAPEYAGQSRGFSKLAHAIQEFQNLTDFTTAQIKKAIIESSLTVWVKPGEKAGATNPLFDQMSGPIDSYDTPRTPGEGDTELLADEDSVNYARLNQVVFDKPGSVGVFNLNAGEGLESFKPSAPSESYSAFVEAFIASLASSVNMPPEILLMKFSQNYSASRAALILFWRVACVEREEEASDFYTPVFKAWLAGEIAAGRIEAPGWSDPRMRAAWCLCTWNGPPMPNIDPAKTAKADQMYIEMCAQTPDHVARTFNGSSGAANRAANARQVPQLTKPFWSGNKKNGDASAPPDTGMGDDDEEEKTED